MLVGRHSLRAPSGHDHDIRFFAPLRRVRCPPRRRYARRRAAAPPAAALLPAPTDRCHGAHSGTQDCVVSVYVAACPAVACPSLVSENVFLPQQDCLYVSRASTWRTVEYECIDSNHATHVADCVVLWEGHGWVAT